MKEFFKKYKNHILSFFIPFIILCMVFLCLFILVPRGNSILLSDMEIQYNNLFTYFKNHGFETFSFQKGLGGNMIGTFAYYLSSPFNVIALFFSEAKMDLSLLLILTLKISFSGFTMYVFLNHKQKKKNFTNLLLFSTAYALMGYHVAYFFNIMWLDATYILPIVILGLEKLITEKKCGIYIFSLFYAVLTNYYMGYIICIFVCLYFVYQILLNYELKKDKKEVMKIFGRFVLCSFLAVGMSLFLLLPTILELSQISKNNISPYENGLTFTNPLEVLSYIFIGARNNELILSDGVYNLYFGTMNLILLFFYFMNKKISKKEKILSFSMILIFVISIFVNYVDYIWHAFTETSSFSARYLFLLTFFNLTLCAKSYQNINEVKKENYFIFLILFIISSIITLFGRYSYINNYILLANNVLVVFYLILLYYLPRLSFKRNLITILILALTFGELFFNFYISIRDYNYFSRYEIQDIYNTFNDKIDKIKEDEDFYRIEKNYTLTVNDSYRYDVNSNAHFLSTIHNKTLSFLGYTSYSIGTNYANYFKVNPVVDSILGNKYLFLKDVSTDYYEKIDELKVSNTRFEYYNQSTATVNVYKNSYAFSLGTLVNEKAGSCSLSYNDDSLDRLKFQNNMIECLSGQQSTVFEKVDLEKIGKNKYKLVASGQRTLYLVPKIEFNYDDVGSKMTLKVNGQELYDYNEGSVVISNFAINSENDVEVIIELENTEDTEKEYEVYAYYFNFEEFKNIFSELNSNKMEIIENDNGYIKGEVTVEDNNYLFLNTEYTDEWEIKVDGKSVEYDEVFNTFIGLKLDQGKHTIEMIFHPKGWKIGISLSIVSLVLTLIYLKKGKKR